MLLVSRHYLKHCKNLETNPTVRFQFKKCSTALNHDYFLKRVMSSWNKLDKSENNNKNHSLSLLFFSVCEGTIKVVIKNTPLVIIMERTYVICLTRAFGLRKSAMPRTVRLPRRVRMRLPFFRSLSARAWPSEKWYSMSRRVRVYTKTQER